MDSVFFIVILFVVFALVFDFINVFHDTANVIATCDSTTSLTPRRGILLVAAMNFIGALTFPGVAQTITSGIADPFVLDDGTTVILAALLAAIIWTLVTWY